MQHPKACIDGDPEPASRLQEDVLATLGGDLPRKGPGARGLTQLMLAPECDRVLAIRAARVDPGAVARAVYGLHVDDGSHISFSVGVGFERRLTENDARRIIDTYQAAGTLCSGEHRAVDLKAQVPGSTDREISARLGLTAHLIRQRMIGVPEAPSVLIHPLCQLRAVGGDVLIEPDVLVIPGPGAPLRLAEIKAIPDRGSRTSINDVARARAQAAVEVLAIRAVLRSIGVRDPERWMPPSGDLLLRKRLSTRVSRHRVDVSSEVASLRRALDAAAERMAVVGASLSPGARLDDREILERIPNHYAGACHAHCALAPRCEAAARAAGDPAALGDGVRDALGAVGSIPRLIAIVEGRESAASPAEQRLVGDFLRVTATLRDLDERRAHAV